mgnify:CR=1 FL=1
MSFFATAVIDTIFLILACSIICTIIKLLDLCVQNVPRLPSYFENYYRHIVNRHQITPIHNTEEARSYVIVINPSNVISLGSYSKEKD